MKTATLIGTIENTNKKCKQSLYKMEPTHEGYEYVVASALSAFGLNETYLFGADNDGEIVNWVELNGSMKDTQSHEEAFNAAVYSVINAIVRF